MGKHLVAKTATLLALGVGFVAPSFAEDRLLPPPVPRSLAGKYTGPVFGVEKPAAPAAKPVVVERPLVLVAQAALTVATKVVAEAVAETNADTTFAPGSEFTKWLFAICAKDYKTLTGEELPADARNDAKKAFDDFKKKHQAHEGAGAPRGAILFFADRLALANGDGTATANALDGSSAPDVSVPVAKLGALLGWAPCEGGTGGGAAPAPAGGRGGATETAPAPAAAPAGPVATNFPTNMSSDERVKKMIAMANWITAQHYSYLWGGGHNAEFKGPYDCSGSVSAVLHAGGCLSSPMVSGELASWGAAGPGEVTLYANVEHVYMSIDGKFFGTSESNPGGGAAWFNGAPRPGFAVRHVPLN